MFKIKLSQKARSTYENLQPRDRKKIDRGLSIISESPLYYSGHITPLKGSLKGKFRYKERSGWRIIYQIDQKIQDNV